MVTATLWYLSVNAKLSFKKKVCRRMKTIVQVITENANDLY